MMFSFIGQPVFLLEPQLLRMVITTKSERITKINFFIFTLLNYKCKYNIYAVNEKLAEKVLLSTNTFCHSTTFAEYTNL